MGTPKNTQTAVGASVRLPGGVRLAAVSNQGSSAEERGYCLDSSGSLWSTCPRAASSRRALRWPSRGGGPSPALPRGCVGCSAGEPAEILPWGFPGALPTADVAVGAGARAGGRVLPPSPPSPALASRGTQITAGAGCQPCPLPSTRPCPAHHPPAAPERSKVLAWLEPEDVETSHGGSATSSLLHLGGFWMGPALRYRREWGGSSILIPAPINAPGPCYFPAEIHPSSSSSPQRLGAEKPGRGQEPCSASLCPMARLAT